MSLRFRGTTRFVALLLLNVALAAGCAGSPSVAPTPTVAPSRASGSCTTSDVQATGGPWSGAAGSRGADVTVKVKGTTSCLLPPRPVVAILDATGTVLVQTRPVVAASQPPLTAGAPASFSIILSNWCDAKAKLPLRPALVLESGAVEIAGLSLATPDDLPPCNGPGQPASLSATEWD
jgi:hypothetical protein